MRLFLHCDKRKLSSVSQLLYEKGLRFFGGWWVVKLKRHLCLSTAAPHKRAHLCGPSLVPCPRPPHHPQHLLGPQGAGPGVEEGLKIILLNDMSGGKGREPIQTNSQIQPTTPLHPSFSGRNKVCHVTFG